MLRAYSKTAANGKRGRAAHPTRIRAAYRSQLLADLGCARPEPEEACDAHPALLWAASGCMALTGRADGPPVAGPAHLAACARGAVDAFAALAGEEAARELDGAAVLAERSALLGLRRAGAISVGGHCRLLPARDGWLAVNLPRPDDRAALPAWLGIVPGSDSWDAVAEAVARRCTAPLLARARLLGLAVAPAAPVPSRSVPWFSVRTFKESISRGDVTRAPLIVDLSSLWAGPLATHLLARAGARVVKVESTRRPDGARSGSTAFFDLLNGGKESVALDLGAARDRARLARLLARADIVVESARPRALRQLDVDAAALVRARPGLVWVGITGYGRRGAAGNWIAFGDDAAVAAGLATAPGAAAGDTPLFCADAIADPLTGLHAAVAALAAWRHGGGVLLSIALRDVAAHALAFAEPARDVMVRREGDDWEVTAAGERQLVQAPRARLPLAAARPLGADTDRVLREVA